ncbi:hypothetical protein BK660_16090 [Pseudomonas brassicacearum]|uniref:Uncharacterized protein n=1 Tax=Pseudomonas brassicacearum TaxID=930166 RepID=A0A423I576_9PSED|nr:hypothetical protein [Pseudomonas brassicacearum]RON20573.1 hypothetical protein BK660_16090 [Pseudomonas brassicacearum]
MLDRTTIERDRVGMTEVEWPDLTKFEHRLIELYRRLGELDQQQVRRVAEILVTSPKASAVDSPSRCV